MKFLFTMVITLAFSGCATQTGLYSPSVEKVCVGARCYLRAYADIVNRRCTKGKKTWDDGTVFEPLSSKTARCCTVLHKKLWDRRPRYAIWMADGEEECGPHEECHIAIYEADNFQFIAEHHKKCHDFGLGKPKKRV